MRLSTLRLLPFVAAVALSACGDDVTAPETDLSSEERSILGAVLFKQALEASLDISLTPPAGAAGPEGAPVDFSTTVQVTVPCLTSGSVATNASVAGTVDDETGAADVTFSVTQAHENCAFTGGQDPMQFLINGTPGTTFDFDFIADGVGAYSGSGSLVGSFDYAIDDRTGSCTTDLVFSGSGTQSGGSYTVSGTVCGATLAINVLGDAA